MRRRSSRKWWLWDRWAYWDRSAYWPFGVLALFGGSRLLGPVSANSASDGLFSTIGGGAVEFAGAKASSGFPLPGSTGASTTLVSP